LIADCGLRIADLLISSTPLLPWRLLHEIVHQLSIRNPQSAIRNPQSEIEEFNTNYRMKIGRQSENLNKWPASPTCHATG